MMSAVQPCIESKEMATSSVEFLESFRTIDEEKDSDEESFHLFLDGDDEFNKSDEKIQLNDANDDANKNNDEEKEKVNEPITNEEIEENLQSPNNKDSVESGENHIEHDDKSTEDTSDAETKRTETLTDADDQENLQDHLEMSTEENAPPKENEKKVDETVDNKLISNGSNDCEQTEIVSNEGDEEKGVVERNKDDIEMNFNVNSEDSALITESEDDILNKHDTETSDAVEELDPTLEESLLNDKDEEIENKITEETPQQEEAPTSSSSVKLKNDETESVVADQAKLDLKMNEESVDLEQNEVTSGKVSVSEVVSQKCDDNSNGSSPSDTEDLLDISMIKDSAQDDADIAEDAFQLEQEKEESDGNATGNSKTVELIGDDSNLENSDEDGKGYGSESQEASEPLQNCFSDSEKDKDLQENEDDKEENLDKEIEDIQCDIDEPKEDNIDDTTNLLNEDTNASQNEDKASAKRPSPDDILESEPKKIKLAEEISINKNEDEDAWDITELQSLISFSKFMTKSRMKQLTRADLEEFCVQKLCEAILHKSELGETNHQLKIQEQTIESLRKEQAILTKQIKDLEIVNKKLMHEVRNHLGNKPIVPVKITRSVGLQVRMSQGNEPNNVKRRSTQITPQKNQVNAQTHVVNNRSPRVAQSNTANRQVLQKSPQKPSTPILSQVLQNRNRASVKVSPAQNNTPARPNLKSKTPVEKRARTTGSFIDLTDEDDKRANSNNQNALKTMIPQGVRINTIPKTTMSSVLPTVVSSTTPQVMYVVQSNSQIKQGLLTTPAGQQKAVLVNFQPTNGVIGSLNTSSVSVIPKVATSVQLKTTNSSVKKHKHPAPLPNPPSVQGPANKSLKGIPPKPELSIRKTSTGIILQWRMPYDLGLYEGIASYQLYAYQETSAAPSTDMWRKVGDVKAMALPMACTLTQFPDKNKYYFAVRPVDIHKRIGRFSDPEEISL